MLRWLEKHSVLILGVVLAVIILVSILAAGYISLVAFPLEQS
jgi:hypothetical protein